MQNNRSKQKPTHKNNLNKYHPTLIPNPKLQQTNRYHKHLQIIPPKIKTSQP